MYIYLYKIAISWLYTGINKVQNVIGYFKISFPEEVLTYIALPVTWCQQPMLGYNTYSLPFNSMDTSPCLEPEPKGSRDSLSPPGSKSRHWLRLLPWWRWRCLGVTFLRFGALRCTLLGSGHGAVFRDLLFRTASSTELVVVLELAEALCDTLRCEPGLGVVIPALNKGFAHHLDALQRRQREQLW